MPDHMATLCYKWYGYGRILSFEALNIHTTTDMYVVRMTILCEVPEPGNLPPLALPIDRFTWLEPQLISQLRVGSELVGWESYSNFFDGLLKFWNALV